MRQGDLLLRGVDLGVLRLGLGLYVVDLGLRRSHAGHRLLERSLVVAVVDAKQDRARFDGLIIRDSHLRDAA